MSEKLNNSSLLLLYLVEELSAKERLLVEQMLGADPALREELSELDGAISSFGAGMAQLDATPLKGESTALTRIGSVMRQRMAERSIVNHPKPIDVAHGWHIPAWAYPMAAAAMLLVCLLWYKHPTPTTLVRLPTPLHSNDPNNGLPAGPTEKIADDMTSSFDQGNPAQPPKSVASLEAAEEQIAELSNGGADPVRSFFPIPDGNE